MQKSLYNGVWYDELATTIHSVAETKNMTTTEWMESLKLKCTIENARSGYCARMNSTTIFCSNCHFYKWQIAEQSKKKRSIAASDVYSDSEKTLTCDFRELENLFLIIILRRHGPN